MDQQPRAVRYFRHLKTLTFLSLVGLAMGLMAGSAAHTLQHPFFNSLTRFIEPLGALWTNALAMIVLPLVISNLIVGIASVRNPKTVGRLGGLSIVIFLALLALGAILSLSLTPPLIARLSVDPAAITSSQGSANPTVSDAADGAKTAPTFAEWLTALVPPNPFRAASDGALLPLMFFIIPFSLAITRLAPEAYQLLLNFFQAISDAMLILVRWVLWLAPVGIFALTFSFAARTGIAFVGVLGYFVIVTCALLFVFTLVMYPIVAIFGRVSLQRFAQAVLPAQLIGISSRSSLASLPALMEGAKQRLRLPSAVIGFVLPLSVSTFKANRTISAPVRFLFLAHLYGIDLTPVQIGSFLFLVTVLSFSTPGIPSTGAVRTIPAYLAAGIPIEAVLVFNAVEPITDIFGTLLNVTADMTVATIVARGAGITTRLSALRPGAVDESTSSLQPAPELSHG